MTFFFLSLTFAEDIVACNKLKILNGLALG